MNNFFFKNETRAIGFVLIGALLLRLYTLGSESFWLDESIIWGRIRADLGDLLTDWDSDTQGPIYSLIIWPWSRLFGVSEFSLRLPSVFFGVLGVHVVYLLGRRLFSHLIAMWAAIFAAVNPFLIYYSQEARPYALWFWITLLSVWFLLRLIEKRSWSNSGGYVLSTIVALYTHPYGPFLLALHLMVVIVLKPWSEWKRLLLHALVVVVCYLPMAFVFLDTFRRKVDDPNAAGGWITQPDLITPANYMSAYFGWNLLGAVAGLALVVGLLAYRKRLAVYRSGVMVCIAIGVAFFVLPWIVSQEVPILWSRFTIPVVGGLLLLLGLLVTLIKKPLQVLAVGLFLIGTAIPMYHYYTKVDKGPWREMMSRVSPLIAADDAIILQPALAVSAIRPYYTDFEGHQLFKPENAAQVEDAIPDGGTVWFITATYHETTELRRSMYAELENRCDCETTLKSVDLLPRNPFASYVEEIEITRCRVREQTPLQP